MIWMPMVYTPVTSQSFLFLALFVIRVHRRMFFQLKQLLLRNICNREGLMISYKKLSKVGGVAAHFSTLACPKAQQEARLLSVALKPRVIPRSTVWPKCFQEVEPSAFTSFLRRIGLVSISL